MILSLGWQRPVLILTPCWSVLELWQIKLENSSSTNWIFSLQKSISKLIFAGYTGSKNSVWNRPKIQFVELDFSKLIFQKSSTDQQGVWFHCWKKVPNQTIWIFKLFNVTDWKFEFSAQVSDLAPFESKAPLELRSSHSSIWTATFYMPCCAHSFKCECSTKRSPIAGLGI